MGTCCSISRSTSNQGPLIASTVSSDPQRWVLNRQSYTVRSPSNRGYQMEIQGSTGPTLHIQEGVYNNHMKRRRNSMTMAAGSELKRNLTSSVFITSPSGAGTRSMDFSEEAISSRNSHSEAPKFDSVSECAAGMPKEGVSSSDISVNLLHEQDPVSTNPISTFAEPTVRERLFGTFEHRIPAFKAFYSRPEAFQYECSPFFKTIAKQFHPNMSCNTLEGTITKQKGFVLHSGDIQVPEGESENQWLGKHVIHFYNSISVFYHRISRLCSNETCPKMHAGSHVEYKWQIDKGQIRTVSAPKYMRLLFAWIDKQISDPSLFPFRDVEIQKHLESASGDVVTFPKEFRTIAANILRKLWRVITHLYYGHFKRIKSIGLEDELNFRFYHLAFFVLEFDLVPSAELRPLRSLIVMRLPKDLTVKIDW